LAVEGGFARRSQGLYLAEHKANLANKFVGNCHVDASLAWKHPQLEGHPRIKVWQKIGYFLMSVVSEQRSSEGQALGHWERTDLRWACALRVSGGSFGRSST